MVVAAKTGMCRSLFGYEISILYFLNLMIMICYLQNLPLADLLGFQPLPMTILLVIGIIVVLYILAAEITKRSFYKRVNF
jgi:Mg2+-importing ATPase